MPIYAYWRAARALIRSFWGWFTSRHGGLDWPALPLVTLSILLGASIAMAWTHIRLGADPFYAGLFVFTGLCALVGVLSLYVGDLPPFIEDEGSLDDVILMHEYDHRGMHVVRGVRRPYE